MSQTGEFEHTALWNNCSPVGPTGVAGSESTTSFFCSIFDENGIFDNGGVIIDLGENSADDPLFCDPASCESAPTLEGDYRIMSTSPCVPALSPCGDWIGSQPVGCPVSGAPGEETPPGARALTLGLVHPNPVRGSLCALLHLARAASCIGEVVDVRGRRIATVLHGSLEPGNHRLEWSASNRLPSGIYFLVIKAAGQTETRSFVVLPPTD